MTFSTSPTGAYQPIGTGQYPVAVPAYTRNAQRGAALIARGCFGLLFAVMVIRPEPIPDNLSTVNDLGRLPLSTAAFLAFAGFAVGFMFSGALRVMVAVSQAITHRYGHVYAGKR